MEDDEVLAIVAPGQGAQTPGFLSSWLELPTFADRLAWLSAVSSLDLAMYGTTADAETIKNTAIAQPLLVTSGMLSALELFPKPSDAFSRIGVVGGHSVGEITAAASVGVLSAEAALVFVRERGAGMAAASALLPTGMSAVVGGQADDVLARISEYGLTAANYNGQGQIVAAGTRDQLAKLAANPPARARIVPLSVAGAFHTQHMGSAQPRLAQLTKAITTHPPRTRLLSNLDGTLVSDGREFLNRMVAQITRPVRWDLCMETMAQLGVTGMLELPPAGTLTGIARRNLKGVELFNLNSPDQLDQARDFVARHGEQGDAARPTSVPDWMLVVAPAKGEFRRSDVVVDEPLPVGTRLGTLVNLREQLPVIASQGGRIVEWLVEDGDPVSPGQPLARLYPTPDADLSDALPGVQN